MPSKGWQNLPTAQEFRDIVREFIRREIDILRPRPQLATVQSIDTVNHKCMVVFAGDTEAVIVRTYTIRPTAAGAVVRVEGTPGSRYITEVVSGQVSLYTGER